MSTIDFLRTVMFEMATVASEGAAYSANWGDAFRSEQVDRVWKDVGGGLRSTTGRKLTREEVLAIPFDDLRLVGFRKWSDETPLLYLIPLYAYHYIADGQELVSVSGKKSVKGTDEIDLDVRGGCIAFGFQENKSAPIIPSDVPRGT